jgi:hypothetical protein
MLGHDVPMKPAPHRTTLFAITDGLKVEDRMTTRRLSFRIDGAHAVRINGSSRSVPDHGGKIYESRRVSNLSLDCHVELDLTGLQESFSLFSSHPRPLACSSRLVHELRLFMTLCLPMLP